jgi:hypothetical protein
MQDTSTLAGNVATLAPRQRPSSLAQGQARAGRALQLVAMLWFGVFVTGQLLFAAYVALFYGRAAWAGDLAAWNKVLYRGWIAGDGVGNAAVAVHLLLAVVVIASGTLQMIPQLRARRPAWHRWNGRLYLAGALLLSVGGLFMVWTRGTVGGLVQHLSVSANAVLILLCAALAWRQALARQFVLHRRWALRLLLAAAGVWFFRVGLMAWLVLHQAPVGFNPKTFEGPFLSVLGVAQFLLPLAVLELFLRAQAAGTAGQRWAMAAGLGLLTLLMALGIAAASLGMWLPRL